MSIKRRQGGLSLVELIMFMVIVGIAVLGLVQVMNLTVRASADPLARKQALLIAESLLEEVQLAHFTFCDPNDANAETATAAVVGAAGCAATVETVGRLAGESRPFDNVNDYVGQFGAAEAAFNNAAGALADVNLAALPVTGYTATLRIAPENLGPAAAPIVSSAAPATMDVLRITVTVNVGNESVVLDGYRTRYAPRSI
ncbi:MSHA pilin protein MshD [Janthinobacterium sp. CG_23.3]|uniref:prepilin-type N-terminal cleavage/methylation domain-containing protein n=1 Tax=unclassified Janthinobacterium TaxID=2610881 RepID=UPI0003481CEA|nr:MULTISPECIES: prepilin-type N-terminal cleavage/methylation domain-containing protein [unclassified Janthinobacterium]MEC5160302.1 MSHA pilin protein MshD [Janthinobacterium sp. CG_S6]